jgi:hypothetical protein
MFTAVESEAQDNIAYQDETVRFTVVTDGVIRLEWQPEGKFTDLPSFVASERDYPEAAYKVRKAGKNVEITTSKMVLTYRKGSGKFTKNNLEIKAADGFFTWKPGMQQKENLKGTFRTLDGLDGDVQTQSWVADMKKGEVRQNYYYFASLKDDVDVSLDSDEGRLQWVPFSQVMEKDMPLTAKFMLEHYMNVGRLDTNLYSGVTTEDHMVFTKLEEF